MGAVSKQHDRFESTHPAKVKAKECSDLVLLSLYVYIPPSRGLEIRTLEIAREDTTVLQPKSSDKNFLIISSDNSMTMRFSNYKTRRFRGRDELSLKVR